MNVPRGSRRFGSACGALLALAALCAAPASSAHQAERDRIVVAGLAVDLAWPDVEAAPHPAAGLALEIELRSAGGGSTHALTTDAEGGFRAELEDPGERPLALEVRVAADADRRAGAVRTTLGEGEHVAQALRLERAAHGALEGEVVDPSGRPLAGARITGAPAEPEADEPRSDAAGRFRIDPLRAAHPLRAELEGYASSAPALPEPLARGGFATLRVVLQPVGRLELRVATAADAGVPELELALVPRDPAARPLERWEGERAWRWTDADGRAVFEGVWAEVPLELSVFAQDGEEWRLPRRAGPLLVPENDHDGRAIELGRGETLSLELRLGPPLFLRGRVVDAEGDPPLGRLFVRAQEVDPPGGMLSPTSRLRRPVESDGSFELELYRAPGLGRLFVTLGLGLDPSRGTLAFALVDPNANQGDVLALDFVATGRASIRGRVPSLGLDAPEYAVRALPAGLSRLQASDALGFERRKELEMDGRFELLDLPRGRYDLVLEERSACFGALAHRFGGIEPGNEVELAPSRKLDVRIRVRARAPEDDVASLIVLAGRCFPRVEPPIEPGPPATSRYFNRPGSWPAAIAPIPGRVQSFQDERAITSCLPFAAAGDTLTLPPVEAGWYVVGVCARNRRGDAYAPVASEPLALGAGFHELVFDLRRTTRIAGRLVGGDVEERDALRVSLIDENGRGIALRKSMQSFTDRVRPKRDGSFVLHEVPLGEHRLWVGTDAELDAGRFQRELVVDARGDDAELLVDLP